MGTTLLTCPKCASQYSVSNHLLTSGRIVRCTVCSNTWKYDAKKENDKLSTIATAPPPSDEEEEQPTTARRPFIPHLPLEALEKPKRPATPTTHAKPGFPGNSNGSGGSGFPNPNSNDDIEIAKKPKSKLSRIFLSSFSWFLIISISANIIFWIFYFTNFSIDLNKIF